MYIKLVQQEFADVEHFETGKKSKALKMLFKASFWKEKEAEWLPIVINDVIEGDDDNIIKRAKKEARSYFVKREANV